MHTGTKLSDRLTRGDFKQVTEITPPVLSNITLKSTVSVSCRNENLNQSHQWKGNLEI